MNEKASTSAAPELPESDTGKRVREEEDDVEVPKKKRMKYTSEEEKLVRDFFELDKRVKGATSADCVTFLLAHQSEDLFVGRTVQHIQDKVKTLLRQKK